MLTPGNFECRQCGKCCRTYTVKLSDGDIARIEKLGMKREEFAERDNFDKELGNYAVKRTDEGCIFLFWEDGKAYCRIYDARPEICRRYPFFTDEPLESCEPDVSRLRTPHDMSQK
jgi:Fe-S-cluster containining protein